MVVYLYDILIYSEDIESHAEHVEEVMTKLEKNSLKLNIEKCLLFSDKVNFLGYSVSHLLVEMHKDKVSSIEE